MKSIRFTFAVLALACAFQANAGSVVVSASSKATAMDAEAVKRAFLGRQDTIGGAQALVVYQKGGATRADFDRTVLGKSAADLSSYWSRLVFTGKARAPAEAEGDAAVKAKVSANPGAIGYIADGAVDSSVKVVYKF